MKIGPQGRNHDQEKVTCACQLVTRSQLATDAYHVSHLDPKVIRIRAPGWKEGRLVHVQIQKAGVKACDSTGTAIGICRAGCKDQDSEAAPGTKCREEKELLSEYRKAEQTSGR